MAIEKHGVRAQLGRGAERHGRVHAELTGFIRRGGNHAAFILLSAYHNGFALQLRIVELFHRDEEGVHVDVAADSRNRPKDDDTPNETLFSIPTEERVTYALS